MRSPTELPARPRGARFPRAMRIRSRHDFVRIQRQGARTASDAFVLLVRGARAGAGRVGLTVSKKVGNAPERNLVKRRLREILRRHPAWFASRDIVIVVHRAAALLTYVALEQELTATIARVELAAVARQREPRRPR